MTREAKPRKSPKKVSTPSPSPLPRYEQTLEEQSEHMALDATAAVDRMRLVTSMLGRLRAGELVEADYDALVEGASLAADALDDVACAAAALSDRISLDGREVVARPKKGRAA